MGFEVLAMADETVKDESKAKGGYARAEALTGDQRRKIARKAAVARWNNETQLTAEFGSEDRPLKLGNHEIGAYVLNDSSRVLARVGFLKAIGRTGKAKGGRSYDDEFKTPVFLTAENLKPFISKELLENSTPIIFSANGTKMIGYRAELLPQVCEVFMDAQAAGVLRANQQHIAETCKLLHRAFAKVGIIGLVDEATGYQGFRPQDALQAYLEQIISKELAAWVKRFPDEFYENIYKLNRWQWPGMKKNRYSVVGKYTRDLVYERLAPTLLQELEKRSPKDESGNRKHRFHQWLTEDVGHPMLAQHLHSLVMFQRLAIASGFGYQRFVKMVDQVLPKRNSNFELGLPMPVDDASGHSQPS
jgi:hypothetical protein